MSEEKISVGEFFKSNLTTPLAVFGHVSAIEYGENHGWDYVWATLSRMHGAWPSSKDTDLKVASNYVKELRKDRLRLEWMIDQNKLVIEYKGRYWVNRPNSIVQEKYLHSTPREAIDAAMKESK